MSEQPNPESITLTAPTSGVGSGLPAEFLDSESGDNSVNEVNAPIDDGTLERVKRLERLMVASANSPTTTTSSMTFASSRLPIFDPSSRFANAESWATIVDLWVAKHKPNTMELIMSISQALKGEAANWFVSARPTEKQWIDLKAEFLAIFAKPVDAIQLFSEAINGKKNVPPDTPLIEEMLCSMRTILSLLKNRQSDESFAVMVACYFGSTRNEYVRRRYATDGPLDAKAMCTMLQGRLGKRPALFPTSHQTGAKRRSLFSPRINEYSSGFSGNCHNCGLQGHVAAHCRKKTSSTTCYKCGKLGHISPNCPDIHRKLTTEGKKVINLCEKEPLPLGQLKLRSDDH